MSLDLDGTPIQVLPPAVPVFRPSLPSPSQLAVIPIQGPTGPQGPPGDAGAALAFSITVTNQSLVQAHHGLPFKPAGIVCVDTNGVVVDYGAVAYPSVGIAEVTFGFPFTGTLYFS